MTIPTEFEPNRRNLLAVFGSAAAVAAVPAAAVATGDDAKFVGTKSSARLTTI
jgi:hypothetical protein